MNARPDMYQPMMEAEGQTIVLAAHREASAVVRGGAREAHATISAEAFDGLCDAFRVWLGTRLMRHEQRTGRGAHNISVEVTVDTAATALEPGGEPVGRVQLQVINGRARLRALEG